nr:hypothetical protein [Candidatus Sigynarchaeota archaeon]
MTDSIAIIMIAGIWALKFFWSIARRTDHGHHFHPCTGKYSYPNYDPSDAPATRFFL